MNPGRTRKPLDGWRVLVPRGGPWGDMVSAELRARGATPVVTATINFAPTEDAPVLEAALADLAAGQFDWLTVTSATTVDVLSSQNSTVPESTRIAAVGETTAAALTAAGYRVDLVPFKENSAQGLLDEWSDVTGHQEGLRILTLRSEVAKPTLTEGLTRLGHTVRSVVAYRTIGVTVPENVVRDVAEGCMSAILVTSGSVAEQVQRQLGPIPIDTLVVAIGPRTASDAHNLGLRVDIIAAQRTTYALIDALCKAARGKKDHG